MYIIVLQFADTVATADGSGVESNSKEALLENRPKVNLVEELEHELRKEDQSLWPSVRNILDEQLHLLNSLAAASSVRYEMS